MDEQEKRELNRAFALEEFKLQQQEQFYREQSRKERNSNIPIELRPYWALGEMGVNVMTVPLEVLSRRHFGSRYLSTGRVIMALIFYLVIVWFGAQLNGHTEETTIVEGWLGRLYTTEFHADIPDLMVVFALVWIPAAAYNVWVIKQRQKRRIRWHTRSTGISFLQGRLPGNDWVHYRFWEPLMWLVAGLIFLKISYPFGLYLSVAALLLLVRNNQLYAEHNTDRLNREDIAIVAELTAGGLREGGKAVNFGYDPISVPEDVTASIEDIERDLREGQFAQRLRAAAARAPREWETVGTIVASVTSKPPVAKATAPAAASPPTPPPPAPVWHQAEDWPDDEAGDSRQHGHSAHGVTPA